MASSWQRQVAAAGLSILLLLPPASVAALPKDKARVRIPETGLTENQQILHALNRLGYGPRPGKAERVRAMGLERWIERQLYPEKIPDQEMGKLLRQLPTLVLSQAELMVEYPPPQLLRQIERQLTSRMGMDPGATAELFPELAVERERRAQRERRRGADRTAPAS